MKILLDSCVSGHTAITLRGKGHDVVWAGDWSPDPGDEVILHTGHAENRVVITIDKDFGELAIAKGIRHYGLIRLVGFSVTRQSDAIEALLSAYGAILTSGAILTAEPWRVRVREP